jgi:hypothetical protein
MNPTFHETGLAWAGAAGMTDDVAWPGGGGVFFSSQVDCKFYRVKRAMHRREYIKVEMELVYELVLGVFTD